MGLLLRALTGSDFLIRPLYISKVTCCAFLLLVFSVRGWGQSTTSSGSTEKAARNWIFKGTTNQTEGLGIADYSRFNPEKSWREALENAVNDLNANHSLIVSYYGYRIGQGPLRIQSNYAIRTFLDTTQVSVIDSARWKGRAFIRIKPMTPLSDSLLYPNGKSHTLDQTTIDTTLNSDNKWLLSTGSTPRIDSNWYMSMSKAKQDALRKLAEDLSVRVETETYSKGATVLNYYNFSTLFAFQRIRVLKRIFNPDSVKVQIAVHPREIKMLMD